MAIMQIYLPESKRYAYYYQYFDKIEVDGKKITAAVYKAVINSDERLKKIECLLFRDMEGDWIKSMQSDDPLCKEVRQAIDEFEKFNLS